MYDWAFINAALTCTVSSERYYLDTYVVAIKFKHVLLNDARMYIHTYVGS